VVKKGVSKERGSPRTWYCGYRAGGAHCSWIAHCGALCQQTSGTREACWLNQDDRLFSTAHRPGGTAEEQAILRKQQRDFFVLFCFLGNSRNYGWFLAPTGVVRVRTGWYGRHPYQPVWETRTSPYVRVCVCGVCGFALFFGSVAPCLSVVGGTTFRCGPVVDPYGARCGPVWGPLWTRCGPVWGP